MTAREWEDCQVCSGLGIVGHRYDIDDINPCDNCDGQGGWWLPGPEEVQE